MLKINKRLLIALLAFALPFGCVGCSDGGSATYEQISGAEAKALMDGERSEEHTSELQSLC